MDTPVVNLFTNLAGPWGLVGVLLFVLWDLVKRNDRSVRTELELFNKTLQQSVEAIERSANCAEQHTALLQALDTRLAVLSDRLGRGGS